MSYTEDIARALIDTLTRTAGLPTFQLAGHVPSLMFWMKEVRHAIDAVAGYEERHQAMLAARGEYDASHPDEVRRRSTHDYHYKDPPRLALSPALAQRLQRELITVADRLIDRCVKEELIDIVKADELREVSGRSA